MKQTILLAFLMTFAACNTDTTNTSAEKKDVAAVKKVESSSTEHQHDQGPKKVHAFHKPGALTIDELLKRYESPDRDEKQKPNAVIDLLGNIKGRTIVDIGAGTGYFSFKLAERGAKVIAADIDPVALDYIQTKAKTDASGTLVEARKVSTSSAGIKKNEADIAIIVNTYHHIEDRINYFSEVLEGLKPGGKLMVIDFRTDACLADKPNKAVRVESGIVEEELLLAEFILQDTNTDLLECQYIITAVKAR